MAEAKRRELLAHLAEGPVLRRVVFHGLRWFWVVVVAVLGVLVFPGGEVSDVPQYAVGDIPRRDVIAPFSFTVRKSDVEMALEAEGLAAGVKPIFEYRAQAYDSAQASAERFFRAVERAVPQGPDSMQGVGRLLGIELTPDEAVYLNNAARRNALQSALGRHLGSTLAPGVAGAGVLSAEPSREVVLRRGQVVRSVLRDSILSYADYLAAADATRPEPRSAVGSRLYRKVVEGVFRPTIVYNRSETERRRNELRRSIEPIKYVVRAGERIVTAHEPLTEEAHERLQALGAEVARRGQGPSAFARGVLGPMLLLALPLSIFWALILLYRVETYADFRQVALFGILFAVVVGGSALVARFAAARPELVPIPLMAMLITMLWNGRVSMIASMVAAVAVATQPAFRPTPALVLMLVPAVAAALSMRIIRRRSQVYFSLVVIVGAFSLAALAVGLTEQWTFGEIGVSSLWGALNALVSAALMMIVLPLAESLTDITTDLTLLELSDPSRPLLRRLATEAPGTYAHSIAMANICERAANTIGANGLLARVGCYYHDVGKLANPQYFVENQARAANPHDRLKPQKSARIIRDHVKGGLDLAAKAGLPKAVRAFIPEHHGTMPIAYFLERAKERSSEPVDLAEFTYPGPLPQSQETAVAMLADSVEAALRVLDDPDPAKVRDAVNHIVQLKIEQGQLRDAPLTLAQLDRIREEFVAVITGMRHSRIDYPASGGGISAGWQADEP